MQREFGRGAALLALATLLGGCGDWVRPALTPEADAGFGAAFLLPWSKPRPVVVADSYTVRRFGGAEGLPVEEHLQVEPGNVWPAEEAPRATLANPDAALRGVPPYRPGEPRNPERLRGEDDGRQRDLAPGADAMPPPAVEEQGPRAQRRRGASSPPPSPLAQPAPERLEVLPVPPGANAPPPRRADGQVVLTPNGPVVTSGGTDRIQSFTTPGGGGGVIHRDGGFTTVVPSGGPPQTFPTPR